MWSCIEDGNTNLLRVPNFFNLREKLAAVLFKLTHVRGKQLRMVPVYHRSAGGKISRQEVT